jgi:SAM-dependent methyltransferase
MLCACQIVVVGNAGASTVLATGGYDPRMLRQGYQVTMDHEATHWWFVARRDLVLLQVRRALMDLAPIGRTPRLLDYGCGTGFTLQFLAGFGDTYGGDVEPAALREFQRNHRFPLLDLTADLEPYRRSFDLLTALDVLEHIEDDVDGLRRMERLLTPGGQMILTVPAYGWLWGGEDVISEHKRRYTKRALVRTSRAAGLEVIYMSYFNLFIMPGMATVIWTRRLTSPNWATRSNLNAGSPRLNRFLRSISGLEARLVGSERIRLPAGAGLVCRLRASE